MHAIYSGNIYANNSYSSIYWPELLNVYAENYGHVYAESNWWGSAPPYGFATSNGGTIDYSPYLYFDPNAGLGKTSGDITLEASKIIYSSDSFFDTELKNILGKMIEEKYEEAIPLYLQRLKREPDKEKKRYILQCLAECYQFTGKKDFKILLDKDARANLLRSDDLYASTVEMENLFLVRDKEYDKAIENLNVLRRDFSNNSLIHKHTTFNLWSLYYQKINDQQKAEVYYNELKDKYSDDDLTITAMFLTGEINTTPEQRLLKKEQLIKDIPKEFSLLGNYPNPFNPSTNINYSLPYESTVELKIYDIIGREVRSFIVFSQPAGHQQIFWDGKNGNGEEVTSGIYLYRIRITSLENNQVFEKTAKLMMVK